MIVLATRSIARRKLIKKCKRNIIFKTSDIDETYLSGESLEEYLLRVSFLKAAKLFRENVTVIGADTVIFFEGKIIGKPKSREEAFLIMKMLSGRVHEVYTGVSVLTTNKCIGFVEMAKVKVDNLSNDLIYSYLKTNEFMGKAGGYAIQGRARYFMKVVEGDITTVIGLPMKRLCKMHLI